MMRPAIFVDTSAYVAVLRRDDEHHQDASSVMQALQRQRATLVTTNFILAETYGMLLRYLGPQAARAFLEGIDRSRATLMVRAEERDEREARAILYRYTDKGFSLVDTISFAVMTRLGVTRAFTFDRHFEQYGWQIVLP
jgi:predicted nucleic acid-binding protein